MLTSTGRYSIGFVIDLASVLFQRRQNIFQIIDEIAILEGTSRKTSTTKRATILDREHLKGYWHKHYTEASNLVQNVDVELKKDKTIHRVLSRHATILGRTEPPESGVLILFGSDSSPQRLARLLRGGRLSDLRQGDGGRVQHKCRCLSQLRSVALNDVEL